MNLFNRKPHTTLDDIHRYVQDLKDLQEQRDVAIAFREEYLRYNTLIELAQKVLERLLEQME